QHEGNNVAHHYLYFGSQLASHANRVLHTAYSKLSDIDTMDDPGFSPRTLELWAHNGRIHHHLIWLHRLCLVCRSPPALPDTNQVTYLHDLLDPRGCPRHDTRRREAL